MPKLTQQQLQQQEEERREQERLLNARFFNKQKWRYRWVDKPWEKDDELDGLPSLSTAETLAKLLKPGLYKRDEPKSPYYFRLAEDGSVKALSDQSWLGKQVRGEGVVSDAEWKARNKASIQFLAIARGETSMVVDFPSIRLSSSNKNDYLLTQLEKNLDMMMDNFDEINRNSDVKVVAKLSDHVKELLDSRPHLHEKYARRIQQQQKLAQSAAKHPEHSALLRNSNYKINQRAISQQDKLTGSDAEKKQQFEKSLAGSGRDLNKITADLERRLKHAALATEEIARHVGEVVMMAPEKQAIFMRENGPVWKDVLNTVSVEQADLQTRLSYAMEEVNRQLSIVAPAQSATLNDLQQVKETLEVLMKRSEKLKNGDANTAGFAPLQQKITEIERLSSAAALRARR